MTIEKAIEIKLRTGEEFLKTDPEDIDEADRLSIEAMKRIVYLRKDMDCPHWMTLPGEANK